MLDNKGFAISTILYALLLMATLVIFLLIGNFGFERNTTSEFVSNIKNELNGRDEVVDSSSASVVDDSDNVSGYLTDISGEIITLDEKFKIISTVNESYVINIEGNRVSTNNSNISLYIADNLEGQEFSLVESDDIGYYYIAQASNKTFVFDIAGASSANNTNIQLYTLNNSNAQKFRFVETEDEGVYYIKSSLGTGDDLNNASVANNANIASYSCNKSAAQKWKLMIV